MFQDALLRRYLPPGRCRAGTAPLIKRIAAVAGDHVEVRPEGVSVDGELLENSAPLAADRAGRTLRPAVGGVVPEGCVWLISTYSPFSFDSRYFGPIPIRRIEGAVTPVLTL